MQKEPEVIETEAKLFNATKRRVKSNFVLLLHDRNIFTIFCDETVLTNGSN